MLNLEDFMNIRDLKQQGWSVSAIAGELHLDRKTVRKRLLDAPQPYKRENPAPCKIDPYRPFLRERWEKGVHNARKLLDELRARGYDGGYSQLKLAPKLPTPRRTKVKYAMLAALPAPVMFDALLMGKKKAVKLDSGKPEPAARNESSRSER